MSEDIENKDLISVESSETSESSEDERPFATKDDVDNFKIILKKYNE